MKRVVITGLGLISSIGNNKKEVLFSLKKKITGISFSEKFKNLGMKSHVWGDIKFNSLNKIDIKKKRFMNKSSIYAFYSMEQAIIDSKLKKNMISNNRTGLIVGSGMGSPKDHLIKLNKYKKINFKLIEPYKIIKSMQSSLSACLATSFKIKGINYSISSACTTSINCIINAIEIIQNGKQDIIFAGGSEELCWETACKFDAMKILSKKYNNNPSKASRAYDIDRDGFVISGGSGIIILEELNHALKRNAYIYAEIIGYGLTSSGNNMVNICLESSIRCMKIALNKSNINSIDYINTHGTSTKIGDVQELIAIKKIFGKKHPKFSSTKSITGHSLGTSGVHEIIYSLLMLENNFICPSVNIYLPDPEIKNMNIVKKIIYCKLNKIMSNNFGFGGTSASIILKKKFY